MIGAGFDGSVEAACSFKQSDSSMMASDKYVDMSSSLDQTGSHASGGPPKNQQTEP